MFWEKKKDVKWNVILFSEKKKEYKNKENIKRQFEINVKY